MYAFIELLNNNKILWGATMLLLNFGSRFVVADLGKFHESILANQFVKKIIVFSMFFVATRDIITAILLTLVYIFIIDGLLHEKRKFCIVPKKFKDITIIDETQYLQAKQKVIAYELKKNKEIKNINEYDKYNAKIIILNK